jgi:hypothetical protein
MNRPGRDWVAIYLAIGIATALNLITLGVLYDAITSEGPGLSSNATQVLVMGFGGIIGVLGSYLGYKVGQQNPLSESSDEAATSGDGGDASGGAALPARPVEAPPDESSQ